MTTAIIPMRKRHTTFNRQRTDIRHSIEIGLKTDRSVIYLHNKIAGCLNDASCALCAQAHENKYKWYEAFGAQSAVAQSRCCCLPDDVSCDDADDIALCYALRVRVLFALRAAYKYAGTFMFKNPVCPLLWSHMCLDECVCVCTYWNCAAKSCCCRVSKEPAHDVAKCVSVQRVERAWECRRWTDRHWRVHLANLPTNQPTNRPSA